MEYEVKRGIARHKGALYYKGSFFEAEDDEAKTMIRKGIIVAVPEKPAKKHKEDDTE